MGTEAEGRPSVERYAVYALVGLVLTVGLAVLYSYWTRPPQMGTSEDAFHTVDALYTAVRSRDEARLNQCEQRLKDQRHAGKLPPEAADSLDAIIHKARGGAWETATARLYEFMLAQRREGTIEAKPPPAKKSKR
ncbi:hypothetical protein [Limnoglobus roseus]|uniref:Uncharacterized protein n=1 Tax=Limnoglobus roseus TaxID=2598579 RepID=A0A5C1ABL5_9BACT|nr:hypothetical protein [Limnoglobus roseus]QEL15416.1 hypothetical protein PX52LOC_02335 [Limnoglobus roseus]